jgi:glycosyltransferase involved in cell wall biosynthesis
MVTSFRGDWNIGMFEERGLDVLQVSASDTRGGAQVVAWNLFNTYRQMGHRSRLAVGFKYSCDPDVIEFSDYSAAPLVGAALTACENALTPMLGRVRGAGRLRTFCSDLKRGIHTPFERFFGREDFNFPGSHKLLLARPDAPGIVHCHNLHGGYFDLRILPELSRRRPVVLTLHDAWLLSGHCAHSFDCVRWQSGCGYCPDLSIYPKIARDATAFNWRRKREIFAKSRLYVATPCDWLMKRIERSILAPAVRESRIIPNGVNLNVFRPIKDREAIKKRLGIDSRSKVVLFVAQAIRSNSFKDYSTFRAAIQKLGAQWSGPPILILALGDSGPAEQIGQVRLEFVPLDESPSTVALYLNAADVYAHAAKADTFPNVVIEALACGRPVVASAVGGIPEQFEDKKTGFLIAPRDPNEMAVHIELLLRNDELCQKMGAAAHEMALQRFDLRQQAERYLNWYRSILDGQIAQRRHDSDALT